MQCTCILMCPASLCAWYVNEHLLSISTPASQNNGCTFNGDCMWFSKCVTTRQGDLNMQLAAGNVGMFALDNGIRHPCHHMQIKYNECRGAVTMYVHFCKAFVHTAGGGIGVRLQLDRL